jgi:hypothetical protein
MARDLKAGKAFGRTLLKGGGHFKDASTAGAS